VGVFFSLYEKNFPELDLTYVYNCSTLFIKRYLTTFYLDDDFHSLQCALALHRLLIRYHDPEIANFFEEQGITPEMYATPWFLTYFTK